MFLWAIQITVISISLIFLIHSLINFFKSTLTVPKMKDLVNTPNEKYKKIFDVILKNEKPSNYIPTEQLNYIPSEHSTPLVSEPISSDMKNELKNFLKKQLHNSDPLSGEINNYNANTNYYPYK